MLVVCLPGAFKIIPPNRPHPSPPPPLPSILKIKKLINNNTDNMASHGRTREGTHSITGSCHAVVLFFSASRATGSSPAAARELDVESLLLRVFPFYLCLYSPTLFHYGTADWCDTRFCLLFLCAQSYKPAKPKLEGLTVSSLMEISTTRLNKEGFIISCWGGDCVEYWAKIEN